ncbi:MAG TPA: hypothetical protein VGG39_28805 [Polyangiaceae bacterium]|jgi:hypothetical protein
MRRGLVLGALVPAIVTACTCAPGTARAGGDDVAAAQVLFEEGRRLMQQRDWNAACPKLAESQRLSPAVGTEFNLADCWEHLGRLASAWDAFIEVVDQTHRRGELDREHAAKQRAELLEPRLGKLVIEVPASARAPGLEVRRDGAPVRDSLWGIAVPIDAGEHLVEATAPGRGPWSSSAKTSDGRTATLRVPDLAPGLPPPSPAPVTSPSSTPTPAPPLAPTPAFASAPDHTAAFLVLGAAVLLAGGGALSLFERQSRVDAYNSDPGCPGVNQGAPPAYCQGYVNQAATWKTVTIVSFAAAGVALVGGVALWITAPRPAAAPASSFSCAPGLGSIGCGGVF